MQINIGFEVYYHEQRYRRRHLRVKYILSEQ